jgi:hypothetical protein
MTGARHRAELILLAISWAVALAAAATVLDNELVWDDVYFVDSFQDIDGVGRFGSLLTRPFWEQTNFVSYELPAYWRPLTSAALGLVAVVAGGWAPAFHLLSLIAALAAAAAFGLVAALALPPDRRALGAWLALIFFAHPLTAEVLCMVANVGDHLVLIFLVLELLALRAAAAGSRRGRWLSLAGVAAFLACCAKEVGVVGVLGPLLAWALFSARTRAAGRAAMGSVWPWLASIAPASLFLVLRGVVLTSAGRDPLLVGLSGRLAGAIALGPGQALEAALVPVPQGVAAVISGHDPVAWAPALAFWLGLGVLAAHAARRRRLGLGLVGVLTALILLAPSLLGVEARGDDWIFAVRYFDLPLAGLLVAAIPVVEPRWASLRWAAPVAVVLLSVVSLARISEWQRALTFYRAEVGYRPDSPLMLSNLASSNAEVGDYGAAEEAADAFDATLRGRELESDLRIEIVRARIEYMRENDAAAARRRLEAALRRSPDNLSILLTLTEIIAHSGSPEAAVARLEAALRSPRLRGRRRELVASYLTRYRDLARERAADGSGE